VWFFGALALFAMLVAIGSPLYLLVYHLVPGFRELAGLARVLCLACFGLAGLAAFGLDDLLRRETPASMRCPIVCALVFGLAGLLAAAVVWWLAGFDSYLLLQLLVFLAVLAAGFAVLALRARLRLGARAFALLSVAVLVLDLFGFGIGFNPFLDARMAYPPTEETEWLRDHTGHARIASLASDGMDWMAHNSPMIFGLRDIHGSDSLRVRRSFELVSGPKLDQANYPEPDSPLLDALGVKYLVTRREVGEGWRPVDELEAPIYENLEVHPRAYVVSDDESDGSVPARFERDEPNHVTLTVVAGSPGTLVLTDSYYPGWRAWVDGERRPINQANHAFRGIPIPSGRHEVEMRYEPGSFRVGLFVSLAALSALVAAGAALYLASRDRALEAASRS